MPANTRRWLLVLVCLALALSCACKRGKATSGEPAYVAAPQANLRDRLSAVYNKAAVLKNGEKVEILEKNRRFVRVRSSRGEEGWMEARYLVGPDVLEGFDKLRKENASTPVQAHGITRADLNMHVTPGRATQHLFRLDSGSKVEVLKRVTAEKSPAKPQAPAPPAQSAPAPAGEKSAALPTPAVTPVSQVKPVKPAVPLPPPVLEDWLLVRDAQQRTGWVLARIIDVDVPLEIAQYAEGQRIMAAFVLNQVSDHDETTGQEKKVAQYLVLATEPKDGLPFDYNQLRIFTWNARRHRYETAYRERNLYGVFPVTVGHAVFDKEGDLPYFVVRVKTPEGAIMDKQYKLNGPIVRRVLSPEEQQKQTVEKAARRATALPRPRSSQARHGRRR